MEPEFEIFSSSTLLKPYVKCYWLCTSDEDVQMEMMYPSGHVEFCIDISRGHTVRHFGNRSVKMPSMEVLGHFTGPTKATVKKDTTVLVARFYPYASALFFPNQMHEFTNDSVNLFDILKKESTGFYARLMEANLIEHKVMLLNKFLLRRIGKTERKLQQFKLVEYLCHSIDAIDEPFSLKRLASSSGFSERYIQKLFLDWVGLTPKNFHGVRRFNRSLELIRSSRAALTSIAHECGYYDQAHFIKEFKSYTGMTPSQLQHSRQIL